MEFNILLTFFRTLLTPWFDFKTDVCTVRTKTSKFNLNFIKHEKIIPLSSPSSSCKCWL